MDVPIRMERRKMSKMGKKGKRLLGAKHLGHARKRGSEVKCVNTFEELDASPKGVYMSLGDGWRLEAVGNAKKENENKGAELQRAKIEALYDDFIKKTNKCYRENARSINW